MTDSSDLSLNSVDTPAPWEVVFADATTNGSPENPTRAGFLALMQEGKDVWNAWRNAYPCQEQLENGIYQIFVGPRINLNGCIFENEMNFAEFQFGDGANFEGAKFKRGAIFVGARFGNGASFGFTEFHVVATFLGAQFGNGARFTGARFVGQVFFRAAQFGQQADFSGACFESNDAHFEGSQFGDSAEFRGTRFSKPALFGGCDWASLGRIYGKLFDNRREWATFQGLDPQTFGSIDFGGARFEGGADFSNRRFTGRTNFGLSLKYSASQISRDEHGDVSKVTGEDGQVVQVKIPASQPTFFEFPPLFHNSTLHQDTSFRDAIFPDKPRGNEMFARAYRTLKQAFAQQHAVREEQRFFKLEMAEEAALETGAKRCLYRIYEKVADYGFSFARPVAWGLGLTVFFAIIYGALMCGAGKTTGFAVLSEAPIDWQLTTQWAQFVLLNLFPLLGFDETLKELRSTLFGTSGWWPLLATIAEAMHKICVFLAVFLIGLALRNLFKLK